MEPAARDLQRSRAAELILLASELADRPAPEVARLVALLLALGGDGAACRSSLNADGSPLQICLTTRREGWDLRLIGDPASDIADPALRARAVASALPAILAAARAEGLRPLIDRSWDLLLPASAIASYVEGVAWFGLSLGAPGCAAYFDVTKGAQQDRWERVSGWLGAVSGGAAASFADRLRETGSPMAAGLEGLDAERVRLKLYWRMSRPTPLNSFGLPLLASEPMMDFLDLLVGEKRIDGDGLVMAAGLDPRSGSLVDAKVDICGGHCLDYDRAGWGETVDRLCDCFGLAPLPIDRALARGARLSYVGFGLDVRGEPRLNVYLASGS